MMRGTVPLVIDVFVAAFAGFRFHEELAGNLLPAVDLGRTREERAIRAVSFDAHRGWRHIRILDDVAAKETVLALVTCCPCNQRKGDQANGDSDGRISAHPSSAAKKFREQASDPCEAQK